MDLVYGHNDTARKKNKQRRQPTMVKAVVLVLLLGCIALAQAKHLGGGFFLRDSVAAHHLKVAERSFSAPLSKECDCAKLWEEEGPSCDRWIEGPIKEESSHKSGSASHGAQHEDGSRPLSSSSSNFETERVAPGVIDKPGEGDDGGMNCGLVCLGIISAGSFVVFTAIGLVGLVVFLRFKKRHQTKGFTLYNVKNLNKYGITEYDVQNNHEQWDEESTHQSTEFDDTEDYDSE